MADTIGDWNPAWGPKPQWVGNQKQKRYPKKVKPLLVRCPNDCTKEDVVVFGPPQSRYDCSICQAEMRVTRVVKERAPVETTVKAGDRFGRLVVQQVIPGGKRGGNTKAWCLCDCGTTKAVFCHHLRAGDTKSCGCLRRDVGDQNHPWRRSFK